MLAKYKTFSLTKEIRSNIRPVVMATPQMLKTLSLTERLQKTKWRAKFILNWNSVSGQLEYRPGFKDSFTWYIMAFLLTSELFLFLFTAFLFHMNAFDLTNKEISRMYTDEMFFSLYGHLLLCMCVALQFTFLSQGDDLVTYINKLIKFKVPTKPKQSKLRNPRVLKRFHINVWLEDIVGTIGYAMTVMSTVFMVFIGAILGSGILELQI